MADSAVTITSGSGISIDTRTESTNSQHRQVIVIGDPADNNGVAAVLNTSPSINDYGNVVRPVTTATVPLHIIGTIASGSADSGNPIKSGAKFNASAPTFSDGNRTDLQSDVNGNLKVTLATLIAGEDLTNNVLVIEPKTNCTQTSASVQIKGSAGKLAGVFVSAASATPTIKIWNSLTASGTVLIDTFTPVAATYYNFNFSIASTGIYITISGTVSCSVFYK